MRDKERDKEIPPRPPSGGDRHPLASLEEGDGGKPDGGATPRRPPCLLTQPPRTKNHFVKFQGLFLRCPMVFPVGPEVIEKILGNFWSLIKSMSPIVDVKNEVT